MVAKPTLFESLAVDMVALHCELDDLHRPLLPAPGWHHHRTRRLSRSEVIMLAIAFQDSDYSRFKHSYWKEVCRHGRAEFPPLVSDQRLQECLPAVLVPWAADLETRWGLTCGITFIDSLPLPVCHNRRIYSYPVFAECAQREKGSMGCFYGLKLHLVIQDQGGLLALRLTPAHVDDRTPVPGLAEGLWGKWLGDCGSISQELFEQLWKSGIQLITELKRNRKHKLLPLWEKLLWRKRALMESVMHGRPAHA